MEQQEYSKEELHQMAGFFQQQLGEKEKAHAFDLYQLQKEIARLTQKVQELEAPKPEPEK